LTLVKTGFSATLVYLSVLVSCDTHDADLCWRTKGLTINCVGLLPSQSSVKPLASWPRLSILSPLPVSPLFDTSGCGLPFCQPVTLPALSHAPCYAVRMVSVWQSATRPKPGFSYARFWPRNRVRAHNWLHQLFCSVLLCSQDSLAGWSSLHSLQSADSSWSACHTDIPPPPGHGVSCRVSVCSCVKLFSVGPQPAISLRELPGFGLTE